MRRPVAASLVLPFLQENIQALDKEDMEMWKVPAVSWLLGGKRGRKGLRPLREGYS